MDKINFVKTTSKDVAKLAGVSQSTVSRAFLAHEKLSPATRQRVMKAAEALQYQPNAFARSLVSAQSNFIGILKGSSTNPIFTTMMSELSHLILQSNKRIIYFEAERGQNIDEMMEKVLQYQVEGIILLYASISSSLTRACQNRNIAMLQVIRYSTSMKSNIVMPDNFKAAEIGRAHV